MRNTIAALFFIFASVWVFAAESNMTTNHEITAGFGPVCYPGDPCGPQPSQGLTDIAFLVGPVCYPGDPCGQPGQVMADTASLGPVCYPGDPCGSHPGGSEILFGITSLIGPVCYPGDPCGSKPRRATITGFKPGKAGFNHRITGQ
jgi:hypothetical protein